MKILYVDDEAINLKLFVINLGKYYEIVTAEDGIDGLEKLAQHPDIAIAISDMRMPRMNGIQFVEQANKLRPDILYFILTGFEITLEIQDALNKKLILKYFKKPFNLKDLQKEIERIHGEAKN